MLTVIHINGPINSGKSTVGYALSRLLPDAVFIDGDDHDAPEDAPLLIRISAALQRIKAFITGTDATYLVVAYPLDQLSYEQLRAAADDRGAHYLVLTLAPPAEVALANRGERILSQEERERIFEMYREGYHARAFSNLVLDTAGLTPEESTDRAASMILDVLSRQNALGVAVGSSAPGV
ncbi:shikimate kinase [Microvirga alba]|uniref:Shikimate kinase n=1 Tax=Microvirga alba TaxID=2791025 RepID=A0A931BR74_9HYPH|nr:shikimate kinase [Microvirga alba]MBF9233745.1 shikimate kinase [Microvirga alba]